MKAVEVQSDDETLWCVNLPGDEDNWITASEAYMQQSLRWLHDVIENNDEDALENIINQQKERELKWLR